MRLWITSKRVRLFYCWYKVEPILSLTFVRISFVAGRGFSRHRSFHFIFLSIYVYVGGFFFIRGSRFLGPRCSYDPLNPCQGQLWLWKLVSDQAIAPLGDALSPLWSHFLHKNKKNFQLNTPHRHELFCLRYSPKSISYNFNSIRFFRTFNHCQLWYFYM